MLKRLLTISLLWFCMGSNSVDGQQICPLNETTVSPKEVGSIESLKGIPVLENGRIKPFDTYARNILLRFSGRQTYGKMTASRWLTRLLLAPQLNHEDKIFLINNPSIPQALGIKEEKKRRYSFSQLQPAYERLRELAESANEIEEKQRDVVEDELLRVYANLQTFNELGLSFTFAFPHSDFTLTDRKTRKQLDLPTSVIQFSFLDIALRADLISRLSGAMENVPSEEWTTAQKEIFQVTTNLYRWSMFHNQLPFAIIPGYHHDDDQWLSPWDGMSEGLQHSEGREELALLRKVAAGYWNGQQLAFDLAIKKFKKLAVERYEMKAAQELNYLKLELLYNRLDLFLIAKILYLLTFLIALLTLIFAHPFLKRCGVVLMALGFIPHTVAILMRMSILQRPPVSNLFETFMFVGFVSVLSGFVIEKINKQNLGVFIGSISGVVFLFIASKFSADGDTMRMLVAVLDSNFWLSTHVISITIGYAGACIAGIVGHIYLIQAILRPKDKQLLDSTYRILIGTLGFGLIMTFLGTNLGGIWADQSWGRFWGWDPKENGALMIILWIALLFHAKIARLIGPLGLAVGSVLGIIVTMWAWFGVNLLSIGLHSYGFISGIALNLTVYVVLQLLFIFVTYPIASKKLSTSKQ